jgi:FlaA1/EpsC-like NDP-sugar epimerase/DNA-binding NarL/FixJ family response regulator
VAVGYWLAFLLRFEFPIETEDVNRFLLTLPIVLAVRSAAFVWWRLHEGLWRYVSMRDILAILKAVTFSSAIIVPVILLLIDRHFPWPVFPIDWGICLLFVGGIRLALRAFHEGMVHSREASGRRAMIVGAGDAGELLIREVGRNPGFKYTVLGFVDDDSGKIGRRLHGVEVLGRIDELPVLCKKHDIEEALIAMPSARGAEMRRIIEVCRAARVGFRTLPRLDELMGKPPTVSKIRMVNIEDLLRREPVCIDFAEVGQFILGKKVLVTGAGGSIGSELCRQVARFAPGALIMLDHAENGLFFIDMELRERFPGMSLHPAIGDVTDQNRIGVIFEEYRPQVVFHAAAHKHVPLMEANKAEAVKNNVLGIMVVANAAERAEVEHFVMVSTDKAVRPSSVMGATKRLAEMYVQSLNARSVTRFVTVRFGNVLASEGSVLQVFQRQIEAGGPVTVTHPDMTRYFMTIPEASQLVLQAATQGKGGEIFVLDMGEPVRILDLAKDLITLSGLEAEKDIEIKITGPRPGEKLFEELLNSETRLLPTKHQKIMVAETDPVDFDEFDSSVRALLKAAEAEGEVALMKRLTALVPGFVNRQGPGLKRPKRTERILIVVDDSYTRTALKRILQGRYVILEAENQRDALRLARESRPDLAILNYHLPRTSIGRLCAKIQEEAVERAESRAPLPANSRQAGRAESQAIADSSKLPIILLVDSSETIGLSQLRALGADDRIYKPLPVSIVEKRVEELLAKASGHAEMVSRPSGL